MDPKNHRLEQRAQQESAAESALQQSNTREFASVDDVLRCDAGRTRAPIAVGHRLADSIRREESKSGSGSWWSRWWRRNISDRS